MATTTKIPWCDATLSPWTGCTKVSPGCENCYAKGRDDRHLDQPIETRSGPAVSHWGKGAPRLRVQSFEATAMRLNRQAALRRSGRKRLRVFPSLCDWLDPEVPVEWLAEFLKVVHETPNLDWLLLTKRPELWWSRIDAVGKVWACDGSYNVTPEARTYHDLCRWRAGEPFPNVWIGTSIEDQSWVKERIRGLSRIPARVWFLSCEPLLGPLDLKCLNYDPIDWVIVGGETGSRARPCNIEWIRSIVADCDVTGTPCFVKQVGAVPLDMSHIGWPHCSHKVVDRARVHMPDGNFCIKLRDPKGGNIEEWPEDLRVREWPREERK